MDRLICGDVGYGKTEVALRAAHKAAAEGKQVMMLVPTTILAQQHLGTFRERLRDFAARDRDGLAAAQARRGPRRRSARSRTGTLDILIGTHRLLSRDVRAKDLGLRDRRRGAALRRQAEGAPAPAEAEGRRALALGDADPAHAADEPRRPARHLGDRDAAGGPAAGPHLRRPLRRGARLAGDRARGRPRGPGLLPPQPDRHPARGRRAPARAVPGRRASPRRTGRWTRASSRRRCSRSCAATPTASWRRRSSSRASTSRRRTR